MSPTLWTFAWMFWAISFWYPAISAVASSPYHSFWLQQLQFNPRNHPSQFPRRIEDSWTSWMCNLKSCFSRRVSLAFLAFVRAHSWTFRWPLARCQAFVWRLRAIVSHFSIVEIVQCFPWWNPQQILEFHSRLSLLQYHHRRRPFQLLQHWLLCPRSILLN